MTETENDGAIPPPSDLATIVSSLDNNSNDDTNYYMPAEWEEHSACLILFPHNQDTFRVEKASREIIDLALSIATIGHEAVYLLCKNTTSATMASLLVSERRKAADVVDLATATSTTTTTSATTTTTNLPSNIYTVICPSNDTWARDTGPTFVFRRGMMQEEEKQQQQQLIGLDWEFNAYGGPEEGCYWPCNHDRKIARLVCSETTLANESLNPNSSIAISKSLSIHSSVSVPMILEGGSFHTDGEGTLLTTSECLLNPNRNPHLTKDQIEQVLKLSLGVSKVLWLPHGLDADNDTNGHVDNFCCFVRPGHVVLAWTDDDSDEGEDDNENEKESSKKINNYKRCREAYEYLQSTKDAKGRTIEITKLYLPTPSLRYTEEEALSIGSPNNNNDDDDDDCAEFIRYPGEIMAASYINYYLANEAVLVPQFAAAAASSDDSNRDALAETDRKALETLRPLFSGRRVVGIPSREILLGGGNIHCQTQQVPLLI